MKTIQDIKIITNENHVTQLKSTNGNRYTIHVLRCTIWTTRYTLQANRTIRMLHAHDSHATRTRFTCFTLFWESFTFQGMLFIQLTIF